LRHGRPAGCGIQLTRRVTPRKNSTTADTYQKPEGFSTQRGTIRRTFQFLSLSKCSLQTSFATSHEEVTQFASHWHERCLKDSEFENSIKKMKPSQMKTPMVEFGEVKFVPAVPRSKTSLKLTTRQHIA